MRHALGTLDESTTLIVKEVVVRLRIYLSFYYDALGTGLIG
jgi:hypothetical protein